MVNRRLNLSETHVSIFGLGLAGIDDVALLAGNVDRQIDQNDNVVLNRA